MVKLKFNGMKKRLILIDDESNQRSTLSLVIAGSGKFNLVGEYNSGEEVMKDIPKRIPEIILMGLDLPGKNGIEMTQIIKSRFPHIDILILSDYDDNATVFSVLRAGASGYVLRSANYVELLTALEELGEGGAPMSRKIARMVVEELHTNLNSIISKRERQVMQMIASGMTYSEISEMLNISPQTSKTHIRNIYTKLKVNTKAQAISRARLDRLI